MRRTSGLPAVPAEAWAEPRSRSSHLHGTTCEIESFAHSRLQSSAVTQDRHGARCTPAVGRAAGVGQLEGSNVDGMRVLSMP